MMQRRQWVADFEKPKGDPSAFLAPATTVLSPYLKFGCVSARLMYARIREGVRAAAQAHHAPGVPGGAAPVARVLLHGLLRHAPLRPHGGQLGVPPGGLDEGPGDAAAVARRADRVPLDRRHHAAAAQVGVDAPPGAALRGVLPHAGDLYVHWEEDATCFDRLLLDADWAINNGNWLWLSASAFFSQYHRIYSPITFGKKFDPTGKFIRKFVPVLKGESRLPLPGYSVHAVTHVSSLHSRALIGGGRWRTQLKCLALQGWRPGTCWARASSAVKLHSCPLLLLQTCQRSTSMSPGPLPWRCRRRRSASLGRTTPTQVCTQAPASACAGCA